MRVLAFLLPFLLIGGCLAPSGDAVDPPIDSPPVGEPDSDPGDDDSEPITEYSQNNFTVGRDTQFQFAANVTGDLVVRFLRVAERGTPCITHIKAAFSHNGYELSYLKIEESSGAMTSVGSGGGTLHGGPVQLDAQSRGFLYALENWSTGESWGETHYTIAVRNLTWWPNEITGQNTIEVNVSCEGEPFEISRIQGSREVRIFNQRALRGGIGFEPDGLPLAGSIQDSWKATMEGNNIHVIARLWGWETPLLAEWATPTGSEKWLASYDLGTDAYYATGGPGQYGLQVHGAVGPAPLFVAVVADLPDVQAFSEIFKAE